MLSALSLVNNKVQEFDATNAKTLAELEQVRVLYTVLLLCTYVNICIYL